MAVMATISAKMMEVLTSNSMEVGHFLCCVFILLFILSILIGSSILVDIHWKLSHASENKRTNDLWEKEIDLRERELKAGRYDRLVRKESIA